MGSVQGLASLESVYFILRLGEIVNLTCNFYLSAAACITVAADLSTR